MVKSNFCKASPEIKRLELEPNKPYVFYDVVYFVESRDEKLPNNSAVLVTLN